MPAATPGDLLTLEELARFRRASTLRGAVLVLPAWLAIAVAIALYVRRPSALRGRFRSSQVEEPQDRSGQRHVGDVVLRVSGQHPPRALDLLHRHARGA